MTTVFAVYYNADMTEGRGPMVLDRLWASQSDAEAYVSKQSGIMGRRPPEGVSWAESGMGDWKVTPLEVEGSESPLEDAEEPGAGYVKGQVLIPRELLRDTLSILGGYTYKTTPDGSMFLDKIKIRRKLEKIFYNLGDEYVD